MTIQSLKLEDPLHDLYTSDTQHKPLINTFEGLTGEVGEARFWAYHHSADGC